MTGRAPQPHRDALIARLLPAAVSAVDTFTDPPEAVPLPAEMPLVARAVEKRRREFGTVRHCARQALAALGHPPVPILPGERGAPRWPAGIVGSMTHCVGYRAAAVAHDTDIRGLGIDAEPHAPLPDGVLDAISVDAERAWLPDMAVRHPGTHWGRLLFSAKESVYKAWYPLTGRWLDFSEAVVTVDAACRRFEARLLVPGPLVDGAPVTGFAGSWLIRDGIVLTAVVVPAATGG